MMADAEKTRGWEGCYVTLRASHIRDLGLRGNALTVFSIIYGFASATSECTSTLDYFQWWLGCSRPTALAVVHSLEKNGLIRISKRRCSAGSLNNVYSLTEKAAHPIKCQNPKEAWNVDDATVTITGQEVTQLGLRGRLLICFGIFFECCQDGGEHPVPLSYIAAWTGTSKDTARRYVRKLEAKGFINRRITVDDSGSAQNVYCLCPTLPVSAFIVPKTNSMTNTLSASNKMMQEVHSAIWYDFQSLRAHVPSTIGFRYGFDAYKDLRERGLTHNEIVHFVDNKRREWRDEYPDRSTRYAPRCQRVLETIALDMNDQKDERILVPVPSKISEKERKSADESLIHAIVRGDMLGNEANRLVDARQEALSSNNSNDTDKVEKDINVWCDQHYDEIWSNTAQSNMEMKGV